MTTPMYRFKLSYEDEPDYGWTMTLEGEVTAPTLADAYSQGQNSLGMRLAEDTKYFDRKLWHLAIATSTDGWASVQECPSCGGQGGECDKCIGGGFILTVG